MSKSRHVHMPKLTNITQAEATAVAHMFSLYDYRSTGKIPARMAEKLITLLGCRLTETMYMTFTADVSLTEVLLNLDQIMPPPEPALQSSLSTFLSLTANEEHLQEGPVLRPGDISRYMESLGREPPALREVASMIHSMQEYDDCSGDPVVRADLFSKEPRTQETVRTATWHPSLKPLYCVYAYLNPSTYEGF
ncbi:hypothetical protein B484DRAFT_116940 [Ochromonadaceae sp. CCMP2298]|nr:hypothetical protein B484DRAFT_116940 [Ochromonadaceae sp. CCMP2298]